MSHLKCEEFDNDATPSAEVVRAYRRALEDESEDGGTVLALVHYRGGAAEFELGRQYALSADPLDRVTGADVLAQLGWGKRDFEAQCLELLLQLADDGDDRVVEAAVLGLGHRNASEGISVVLPLVTHADPAMRLAAVRGLTGQDSSAAIAGLITLAADEDRDVRNWAAFGLGTVSEIDTPALRKVLGNLLEDEDPEIRGEALIGLARRKDERVLPALISEMQGTFYGTWCLEAAEILAEPLLLPTLKQLQEKVIATSADSYASEFQAAFAACQPQGQD